MYSAHNQTNVCLIEFRLEVYSIVLFSLLRNIGTIRKEKGLSPVRGLLSPCIMTLAVERDVKTNSFLPSSLTRLNGSALFPVLFVGRYNLKQSNKT